MGVMGLAGVSITAGHVDVTRRLVARWRSWVEGAVHIRVEHHAKAEEGERHIG